MYCINLLPWREQKRQKALLQWRRQIIAAIFLPFLLMGIAYAAIMVSHKYELLGLQAFQQENHSTLSKLGEITRFNQDARRLRKKAILINQLIAYRRHLPEMLSIALNQFSAMHVEALTLDQKEIKVSASSLKQNDALDIFHRLQEQKDFCEIKFSPITNQSLAVTGRFYFSFNIKICRHVSAA